MIQLINWKDHQIIAWERTEHVDYIVDNTSIFFQGYEMITNQWMRTWCWRWKTTSDNYITRWSIENERMSWLQTKEQYSAEMTGERNTSCISKCVMRESAWSDIRNWCWRWWRLFFHVNDWFFIVVVNVPSQLFSLTRMINNRSNSDDVVQQCQANIR